MSIHEAALLASPKVVSQQLADGASVDERDDKGYTALMYAVTYSNLAVVRTLLEAGADPQAGPPGGTTNVLALAVARGQASIVRALIDAGADVNRTGDLHPKIRPFHDTPLMLAIRHDKPAVVAALIEAGADLNAARADGTTAMNLAEQYGSKRIRRAMAEAGAELGVLKPSDPADDIFEASRVGDEAAIRALLADGVPPDSRDMTGRTPLTYAAEHGRAAAFQLLLDAGADPRAGQTPAAGKDVLECAVSAGQESLVRQLLADGYPPDGALREAGASGHTSGFTPLMRAAIKGHLEIARALLDAGADPNAKFLAETPLRFARQAGHKQVVELLKQAGAEGKDRAFAVAKEFGQAAEQPGFQPLLERLETICGAAPQPWKRRQGVYQLSVKTYDRLAEHFDKPADYVTNAPRGKRTERRVELLEALRDEVREAGFLLIHPTVEPSSRLLLFPTADQFAVIAACGVNGINHGLDTTAVLKWLRELQATHPFQLTACGRDFLGGHFLKPSARDLDLAERMVRFCPDLIDGDVLDSPAALAEEMEGSTEVFFWWD